MFLPGAQLPHPVDHCKASQVPEQHGVPAPAPPPLRNRPLQQDTPSHALVLTPSLPCPVQMVAGTPYPWELPQL